MSKQAERVRVPRSSIEPPGAAPVRARPVGRRWTTLWTRDRGRLMTPDASRRVPDPAHGNPQPSHETSHLLTLNLDPWDCGFNGVSGLTRRP